MKNKLKINSYSNLINQIVTLASGLILPRFILQYYGSDVNGLVSSILQYLSIFGLLEMGVGAVVQSTLYKPIKNKEYDLINTILSTANSFYKKLSYILIIYVLSLAIILPFMIESPFDFLSTAILVLSMSISMFAQYFFGITYQIFLNANQENYVHVFAQAVITILNTVLGLLFIINNAPIHIVRLSMSLLFFIRPVIQWLYIKKNYRVNLNLEPDSDAIPQRWYGFAQQFSLTILNSTDLVILSLLSTLENVSVYSVHNMVVTGIVTFITAGLQGVKSYFGNLLTIDDKSVVDRSFFKIEWIMHNLISFLFGLTLVLLNPFINIYTDGIADANYDLPIFASLIVLAQLVYVIKLVYNSFVLSGGYFRETQNSSIIEMLINIIISLLTVSKFGLIGVMLGTLIANMYKYIYLIYFISENILNRKIREFLHLFLFDIFNISILVLLTKIFKYTPNTYINWFVYACILAVIYLILLFLSNKIFYKSILESNIKVIINKSKK